VTCAAPSAATSQRRSTAEAEKRAGWREHGILVVAEQEPRLTWSERELVRPLNAKLYSRRKEAPDD
jgi:hypothetical protein